MGREFLDVFESWASSYDETVKGVDVEYREVFKNYDAILDQVSLLSQGHVLEFGAGTGNLTEKLLTRGHKVTAIEPSKAMRDLFQKKIFGAPHVAILDGDFLDFSVPNNVDTIVSTYAFHHLTDKEKAKAISLYSSLLKPEGKIVFADTMYRSKAEYQNAIKDAEAANFSALAADLKTEYYTTIPYLQLVLKENGFDGTFRQWNDFVWIMEAVKTK